jgi:hypothetical protein
VTVAPAEVYGRCLFPIRDDDFARTNLPNALLKSCTYADGDDLRHLAKSKWPGIANKWAV